MTDESDDHRKRYPPPMFAPAAEPAPPEPEPEPAEATAEPEATAAAEPSAPTVVVSGELSSPAPAAAPAAPAPAPPEEPLLPASYRENDLRTAIGSPAMPEQIRPRRARARARDDEDDDEPRSRRTLLVVLATLFLGLGIAALVILGRLSAGHYRVTCEAKQVIAEQGRSFPPWGTSRLSGDEWKPIPIPPSFQCVGLETDDATELGDAYRRMLIERAEAMLTAKEVTQIEEAAGMLEQALLHARGGSDPHKNARQAIQRMLGDVGYWRASGKLKQAADELTAAAKQFEAAAGQRPRYVSDASAWASYARKLIDDLRAGPSGARAPGLAPATAPATPDRPAAPAGVALPVEPAAGSGTSSGSGADSAEPARAAPDAGVPSGGVLL